MTQHLTLRVFILVMLTVIMDAAGDTLVKKGLTDTGIPYTGMGHIWQFIAGNATSGLLWLGVALFVMTFIIWITALHRTELSVMYPVSGTSYVMVPLAAIAFLHESVPIARWIGIGLITAGIVLVSRHRRPA